MKLIWFSNFKSCDKILLETQGLVKSSFPKLVSDILRDQ